MVQIKGGKRVLTTVELENNKARRSLAANPIVASADQLDRVIDCPEHTFNGTSATPRLLVSKNHSLKIVVRKNLCTCLSGSLPVERRNSFDRERTAQHSPPTLLREAAYPA